MMTKDELFQTVESQRSALLTMADNIYDHPELGFQEVSAENSITVYIKQSGFQVEHGV